VFSSPFFSNFFEFWFIILQNGTKHHANFFGKKVVILYFGFWPQEANSRGCHEGNKFCILDGTKHDPENFSILYFITLK